MIDSANLQAASVYINNQLLSRGLLRDGQSIDFSAFGYSDASRIISVINDLILRRDRDAEQRESLSTAMRNLRAENVKNSGDISALTERAAEAERRTDLAAAAEASMRRQLKAAEGAVRGLKEELARTKALVGQARSCCATEIKRRDRQMDTLKKQVGEAGRTRGAKGSAAVTTITVSGDVDGAQSGSSTSSSGRESWLREETNAFLAGMAKKLSEENESLLRAMRETTHQLREMSGACADNERGGGGGGGGEEAQVVRRASWEEISADLAAVMEHMRSILTNPSFVPIEEVIVREEEIARLKAGWLKMESRWEDAVSLMDAWRQRMATTGKAVDAEELERGIRLSPVRGKKQETERCSETESEFNGFDDDEEPAKSARQPLFPEQRDRDAKARSRTRARPGRDPVKKDPARGEDEHRPLGRRRRRAEVGT